MGFKMKGFSGPFKSTEEQQAVAADKQERLHPKDDPKPGLFYRRKEGEPTDARKFIESMAGAGAPEIKPILGGFGAFAAGQAIHGTARRIIKYPKTLPKAALASAKALAPIAAVHLAGKFIKNIGPRREWKERQKQRERVEADREQRQKENR